MKKKPLFYILLISFWLLNVVSILGLSHYAYQRSMHLQIEALEDNLEHQLQLFESMLPLAWQQPNPMTYLQSLCQSYREETEIYLRVIMPNGEEFGELTQSESSIEALGERIEIQRALQGIEGKSKRFEPTKNQTFLHLSAPVKNGNNEVTCALRASISMKQTELVLSALKQKLQLASLILLLFSFLISFYISNRITKPIKEMTKLARKFSANDHSSRMPPHSISEINELAESLNHMSKNLTDNVSTLNEQRVEQQAVLSSMTEGVLAIDRKERIIHMNRAAAEILEIDPKIDSKKRFMQELIRNSQLQEFVQRLLFTNKPVSKKIRFNGKANKHLHITGSRLTYPDLQDIGALLVIRDISRVIHLEKVRSDFVANVSHELKTPITSIKGFIETLSSDSFSHDEKTNEYLAIVRQQSERLQLIVDDLLTLSRLERKEGYILKKEESISEIISTAISVCQLNAKKQNIRILVECDEKLSGLINGNLIEQAIVNLLTNAIKYSNPETTIVIRAHEKESSLHIEVADEGFGIESRHHDRLFERFYRIDSGRSRHLGGTGLGLSIVKHIIQNHDGEIQLDSTPGKGSTFTLSIPNEETEN